MVYSLFYVIFMQFKLSISDVNYLFEFILEMRYVRLGQLAFYELHITFRTFENALSQSSLALAITMTALLCTKQSHTPFSVHCNKTLDLYEHNKKEKIEQNHTQMV